MPGTADETIHDALATTFTLLVVAYGLWLLLRALGRSRADLSIGAPVAVALVVRLLIAWAVSVSTLGPTLRGGDEITFLDDAGGISDAAFGSTTWTDALVGELHEFVFAVQLLVLDSPEAALRVAQAGIAVAGLALLAVAVYELAGARAAMIAAWVLALEPSSVFFSTVVHKDPNMMLASGLVAFGGATMWRRGDLLSLLPIAAGCLIGVATRAYAGWFLIATGAAVTLHAGLRARQRGYGRSPVLIATVVLLGAIAAPTVWEASTNENLERLQQAQEANVSDESNLALERVDFSTRGAIIVNLPQRVRDVLFRPYPWQLGSASQQFGLLGTIAALVALGLLASMVLRNRGRIMEAAGPLVYLGFFLLISYSLSAGNAGTAFRYRTHLVAVGVCLVIVLWFAQMRRSRSSRGALVPAAAPMPHHGPAPAYPLAG